MQTSSYFYKSILSLLLVCFSLVGVSAQDKPLPAKSDSTKQVQPTVPKGSFFYRNGIIFSGVRFGTDLVKIVQSGLDDDLQSYSLFGELMIRNKYFVSFEYGYQDRKRDTLTPFPEGSRPSLYRSKGYYTRFGVDYNLLNRSTIYNAFYIGFKYGVANFDQDVSYYSRGSDYWNVPARQEFLSETDLSMQWLEVGIGMKVRIVKFLYADLSANISTPTSTQPSLITQNDIPGFGFNKLDNTKMIYQYRLIYKIPLWKTPVDIPADTN